MSIQWSITGSKSYVFARMRAFGLDRNKPSSSSSIDPGSSVSGAVCALSMDASSSTTCQYSLLDVESVQHFLTDCEHLSPDRRLRGITDCDACVILHGNNMADIKNLLKLGRLTRRLK